MTDKEIFEKNIEKNSDMLPLLLAEECGELIQAVSKKQRNISVGDFCTNFELMYRLAEEIADVQIMIEQIIMLYDVKPEMIDFHHKNKVQRLEQRLKRGTE